MERWYVSVMLNRLMFIYFIQKKDFLNGDPDYLRTKLTESKVEGNDRYYTDFLCPLFFEGFAKPESERRGEMRRLLGKVPYLNGGIFQRHQLEELYGVPTCQGGQDEASPCQGGQDEAPPCQGGQDEAPPCQGGQGGSIQIPDAAFEGLFNFFDQYQWHLDERPLQER